jgi:hemerythrin superfamily protein
MIRFDHSHVMVTFHQYTKDKSQSVKKALADTICDALEIHATLEEEVFYPVMRQLDKSEPFVHKAEPEHNDMRRLIAELRRTSASDPRHDKVLLELMRDVIHHVADEETTLLPQAETLMSKARLSELGSQMTKRRMELVAPKAGKLAKEHAVAFSGSTTAMVVGGISALLALRTLVKKPGGASTGSANTRTWANANSMPHGS